MHRMATRTAPRRMRVHIVPTALMSVILARLMGMIQSVLGLTVAPSMLVEVWSGITWKKIMHGSAMVTVRMHMEGKYLKVYRLIELKDQALVLLPSSPP